LPPLEELCVVASSSVSRTADVSDLDRQRDLARWYGGGGGGGGSTAAQGIIIIRTYRSFYACILVK
jgi:hypothetical protein